MTRSRRNAHATVSSKGRRNLNDPGSSRISPEQRQVRAVYDAVEARDYDALERLAFSRFGFCSAELRRVVWLHLLGLSQEDASRVGWRQLLADVEDDGKTARVMQADVQRSVYSWDVHTGIKKTVRDKKRINLSEVMHAILIQHRGKLGYFQGFHDIALVFLEVGTPAQAFHMVERLALFHLSDQLCWPFDQGLTRLLAVLFHLLQFVDAPVAEALQRAECAELHFAVPWVLTWFAHSLPRLEQIMRLFDCLLPTHPAMILYFCVALLLEHRDAILRTPSELPEMVCLLQRLPFDTLDIDDWAVRAERLAQSLPPKELVAKLPQACRRSLPRTTPLLHYPHPWRSAGGADAVVALKDPADLNNMAPIYTTSVQERRWWRPPFLLGFGASAAVIIALAAARLAQQRPLGIPV